jgi:DNA polymerase-3 subunit beta
MHITCEKNILSECLSTVGRTVPSRTTLPILECVLLTAEGDGLRLAANDLEMSIETAAFPAEVKEPGSVALDARLLSEIVRKMPGSLITIKSDPSNITECTSGRALFHITGRPGEEFPVMPAMERTAGYMVKARILRDMIRQTIFSVAADEARPILTGELLHYENNQLTVVAVDGFRISFRREALEGENEPMKAVVPAKALNELSRVLPAEGDEDVTFFFAEKRIIFELSSFTFVSRILEGEFIRYDQIFNEDFTTIVTAERIPLLTGFERACLIAGLNKKPPVKLEIKEDSVIITSNTEIGRSYDEVPCDIDGKDLEIAFNPRYLIDALRAIDEEKVVLRFTAPLSPLILRGAESDAYKYLILPLRIRN